MGKLGYQLDYTSENLTSSLIELIRSYLEFEC